MTILDWLLPVGTIYNKCDPNGTEIYMETG